MSKKDTLEARFELFKKVVAFVKKDIRPIINTILIIMVGVVAYIFFRLIIQEIDLLKHTNEVMISYSNGVETPEHIEATFRKDGQINKVLEELLIATGANRAYLFQLHNGRRSVGGTDFLYISATHEIVTPGIAQESLKIQNSPASIVYYQNIALLNDGYYCLPTDRVEGPALKELLENRAVKSLCIKGVFKDDTLVGFIGVDYVISDMPKDKLVKDELKITGLRIEDVLFLN